MKLNKLWGNLSDFLNDWLKNNGKEKIGQGFLWLLQSYLGAKFKQKKKEGVVSGPEHHKTKRARRFLI